MLFANQCCFLLTGIYTKSHHRCVTHLYCLLSTQPFTTLLLLMHCSFCLFTFPRRLPVHQYKGATQRLILKYTNDGYQKNLLNTLF